MYFWHLLVDIASVASYSINRTKAQVIVWTIMGTAELEQIISHKGHSEHLLLCSIVSNQVSFFSLQELSLVLFKGFFFLLSVRFCIKMPIHLLLSRLTLYFWDLCHSGLWSWLRWYAVVSKMIEELYSEAVAIVRQMQLQGATSPGFRARAIYLEITYCSFLLLSALVYEDLIYLQIPFNIQSLEFVAETSILAEMKIENRGKKYFPWGKKSTSILFSMKIKMMDLWMQIEGRKLIIIRNISVLDFFKFAFRMPQIAQIVVLTFKIFQGNMPPGPPRSFLFFFFNSSRLWTYLCMVYSNSLDTQFRSLA